jgi:hypothetical protein
MRKHVCKVVFRVGEPEAKVFAGRMDPRKVHCLFQLDDPFVETRPIRLRVEARRHPRWDTPEGVVDAAPDEGWFTD